MATRKASCNCGQLSLSYEGPDPERISLCQCYECQKRTGTVLSVQTRIPREQVTIEGQSTTWTFPIEGGEPATFRSCDSGGATYHFCRECGSTVYWDISIDPGRRTPRNCRSRICSWHTGPVDWRRRACAKTKVAGLGALV
jgi:hypothetical protein